MGIIGSSKEDYWVLASAMFNQMLAESILELIPSVKEVILQRMYMSNLSENQNPIRIVLKKGILERHVDIVELNWLE